MANKPTAVKPCSECAELIAPIQAKLDAFVTFLCAPVPKCQQCGLLATRLTTVVNRVMGRTEHLCCEDCTPIQSKFDGSTLEHAAIGDVQRAKETNALIAEARRNAC